VVIDEFQRLLKPPHAAESRLQHRWDTRFGKRGPSIVLCGSGVGMMARLTRRPSAPLYGRLSADLHLRPLDFASVRLLHPGVQEDDRVRRFAVFGGTPFYQQFAVGRTLEESLASAFLTRGAPLLEEPLQLLRMEVSAPDRYHSILQAIGGGTHDLGALESSLQVPSGRLSPYITLLRDELSLIRAEAPVGGRRRRARYVFSDPFFAFYYRFIPGIRPLVESGKASEAMSAIRQGLEAHVGLMFERVAAEALRSLNGSRWQGVPIEFNELGKWWNRQGVEVDLVARGGREILAGEVKWSSEPMKPAALADLEAKARLLEGAGSRPVRLVLVSRGGFAAPLRRAARDRGALLFNMADLASVFARAGKGR
jgi:AAA+ ATPase superfamily predicted ATPase